MFSTGYLITILLTTVAALITLSIHEYSHAYAAYKLGDPTAKSLGRLTVNPIKHIDPLGALCMVFLRFGWAKPVPINARYFKKPKRDFAITAFAGPLSNLITALFSAFVYLLSLALLRDVEFQAGFLFEFVKNTLNFFYIFHLVNVGIAIFNLIPVPPLDGSRILWVVLPTKTYFTIMKHERTIYYVFIGWLILGEMISSFLLRIPMISANPALSAFATYISLSNIIGLAIDGLSYLIFALLRLIPFLNV